MARRNRAEVVVEDEIGVYHCIQRVVRRAFLCGVDPLSKQSFDHRKISALKAGSDNHLQFNQEQHPGSAPLKGRTTKFFGGRDAALRRSDGAARRPYEGKRRILSCTPVKGD